MEFVNVATINVRREYRPGTYRFMSGEEVPCLDLHRNCGLGCQCDAQIIKARQPSVDQAEEKCLCYNSMKRQGVSEIKGSGRAIKEGPDEWIYEVVANLVEARP
ncbi:MAG: hypothetical protein ACEQSK_09925 [Sphingomonadaceae bacterium]|jgi:hypothetical protein